MSKNRFHKGMHLVFEGQEHVVEARLPNNDLWLKNIVTNNYKAVTEPCLIDAWFEGRLGFRGDTTTTFAQRKADGEFISDLSALEDSDPRKKELKRRHAYLKPVVELISQGVTSVTQEILEPVITRVHEAIDDFKRPPNWKTVYYCWYRTLILTEDIRALTPRYEKRGNFSRKFSGGRKREYSEKDKEKAQLVAEIVDEVIAEKYLSRQQLTVAAVSEIIINRIADENLYRSDGDKLPTPSVRSIYDVVDQLDEYEIIKARRGKRIADIRCGMYKRGPQPTRPLERVEIDHTRLDLFVIDPITKMPIGRPTLTLAVDKYTRMILGFYISFHGAGFLAVMHCLKHAILPKSYVRDIYPSVEHRWDVYGIPEMIVVDNGLEFHGDGFEDACLQLGMVTSFCPVKKPWFKAIVERYFRTLNQKLLHELPGTTFSNIFEREDYDPAKNAIIALDTLLEGIHVFIIDYYSQRKHRGIKDVPAHLWDVSTKEYPPALPDRREDLQVLLGDVEYRTIQPYGVEFFDLIYKDDILAGLRKGRKGYRFKIKYDPADISVIHVLDPDSSKYIPVASESQQYTKGLSLWQHKVIQRYARKVLNEKIDVVALCRAKEKIMKIIERDWLKIAQSGPRGRMARFKNIGQPNYEKLVGLAESTDTQKLNLSNLDRQQLYLNSMASHPNGLSDLGSVIPCQSISGLRTSTGDAVVELQPIFNSDSVEVTQKRGAKTISPAKKRSDKKVGPNDNNGNDKEPTNSDVPQKDSDDDLDTTGWSTDELPRRRKG